MSNTYKGYEQGIHKKRKSNDKYTCEMKFKCINIHKMQIKMTIKIFCQKE